MTSFVLIAVIIAGAITIIGTLITYHLLVQRLAEIHILVNSNLTRVQKELEVALVRIEVLESLLPLKPE